MKNLGHRLKRARTEKRFTQMEVAKILGISHGTLSGYERNYRDPDTETLSKLAALYDVSLDWLLTGETSESSVENTIKTDLETFAYRLITGMQHKGISIEQAAEECGVTPEYIQELMTAPKRLPGANTLFNLAMLLDVTPDYLGGFTDDPKGTSPHTPRPKEMTEFLDREEVMFDGVPLTEEDKEKIKNVLAAIFMDAKKRNKRK